MFNGFKSLYLAMRVLTKAHTPLIWAFLVWLSLHLLLGQLKKPQSWNTFIKGGGGSLGVIIQVSEVASKNCVLCHRIDTGCVGKALNKSFTSWTFVENVLWKYQEVPNSAAQWGSPVVGKNISVFLSYTLPLVQSTICNKRFNQGFCVKWILFSILQDRWFSGPKPLHMILSRQWIISIVTKNSSLLLQKFNTLFLLVHNRHGGGGVHTGVKNMHSAVVRKGRSPCKLFSL